MSLKPKLKTVAQIGASLLVLALGAGVAISLTLQRPTVAKEEGGESASLVRTMLAVVSEEPVRIEAFGTVKEHRVVQLAPEVSGRIIEQSPELVVGGLFKAGETLLQIDPRDYQTLVEQEEAALATAEFELKQELGRQVIAEREWELLNQELVQTELGSELALRKPQVEAREAALAAAKARLEKAQLDLKRTELKGAV